MRDSGGGSIQHWHLFEFGDQEWFPQVLRDTETAYLATCYRLLPRLVARWAELISTALPAGEPAEILDLCSGAGGPIPSILEELEQRGYRAWARLTDLYPNPKAASHPRVAWLAEPVDATRVSSLQDSILTIIVPSNNMVRRLPTKCGIYRGRRFVSGKKSYYFL